MGFVYKTVEQIGKEVMIINATKKRIGELLNGLSVQLCKDILYSAMEDLETDSTYSFKEKE